MKINIIGLALIASLSACSGGNPFDDNAGNSGDGTTGGGTTGDGTDVGGGTTGGISGTEVPPGTASPTPSDKIVRYEALGTGDEEGNGYARDVRYDGATDTFVVDNLAFDAANVYQRGTAVSSLGAGQYAVYESTTPLSDPVTGDPIDQLGYRAIYGVSKNGTPATQFAIVRTGSYIPYGFGGFLYQRNGSVTLPDTGQATFTGKTAGIRDFNGAGGLEYTTGQLTIDIDFEDFNNTTGTRGDGIKGVLSNRRVFDAVGNDITSTIAQRIDPTLTEIPTALFKIGPGVLKDSGDAAGEVFSTFTDSTGKLKEFETGNYYAVVSGDDPSEIAGVIVVTNDEEFDDITVRETAGFIVYRGANN
ncbi:hypothetical protein [Pseudosulfitobacter sp. DSM 107133]|uniref:hypothetical protein n=1 Tax=Pseudosulfitobacter sp. DSM 107133 TaxID=2883100 RepID=UPI000DF186EA|nr:hypothetical protein [Pseudosulfitobacter sp. DSM 107133]UOA26431.1 hypothetical protein DSM107133_01131 [Pseudosulfitobacter sp. DSM 107133]